MVHGFQPATELMTPFRGSHAVRSPSPSRQAIRSMVPSFGTCSRTRCSHGQPLKFSQINRWIQNIQNWLVVSTPLKNISRNWDDYSQYIKNDPNHQPENDFNAISSGTTAKFEDVSSNLPVVASNIDSNQT